MPPSPPPFLTTVHPCLQPLGLPHHHSGVLWVLLRNVPQAHGPQGTNLELPWCPQPSKCNVLPRGTAHFQKVLESLQIKNVVPNCHNDCSKGPHVLLQQMIPLAPFCIHGSPPHSNVCVSLLEGGGGGSIQLLVVVAVGTPPPLPTHKVLLYLMIW